MQVMPSTAASTPVKISNIETEENNIHAGMRLMNFLIEDHFNEPGLDTQNRLLFAIASYNAVRRRSAAVELWPRIWVTTRTNGSTMSKLQRQK